MNFFGFVPGSFRGFILPNFLYFSFRNLPKSPLNTLEHPLKSPPKFPEKVAE